MARLTSALVTQTHLISYYALVIQKCIITQITELIPNEPGVPVPLGVLLIRPCNGGIQSKFGYMAFFFFSSICFHFFMLLRRLLFAFDTPV